MPDEVKKEYLPEVFQDMADIIGIKATLKVMEHFKGEQIYVPHKIDIERDAKILRDSQNGLKINDLIKKYNLSYRTIIRIIRSKNAKE